MTTLNFKKEQETATKSAVASAFANLANKKTDAPAKKEEREPVEFWLNIGTPVAYQDVNPETGEIEDKETFVSLDVAIDLENIKVRGYSGSNAFMLALRQAKVELLEALLNQARAIPQGESEMTDLKVQIRHAGNNTAVKAEVEDNPLLKAFRKAL